MYDYELLSNICTGSVLVFLSRIKKIRYEWARGRIAAVGFARHVFRIPLTRSVAIRRHPYITTVMRGVFISSIYELR